MLSVSLNNPFYPISPVSDCLCVWGNMELGDILFCLMHGLIIVKILWDIYENHINISGTDIAYK